jgi:hypothetical protein
MEPLFGGILPWLYDALPYGQLYCLPGIEELWH